MSRLYFALWPDAAVREQLAALASAVTARGARRVQPDRLHLTLAFLGAVAHDRIGSLCDAAARVEARPFILVLDHTGHWPRPRVLWTGASESPAALGVLADGLRGALDICGFPTERRPFHAHVTLARNVRGRVPHMPHAPIRWAVDAFCLVESRTLPAGPEYRTLETFALTA